MTLERPHIALVVTDLDNTLYDWVTFFVKSFYRMVESASALLDVSQDVLLDQLQQVHQHYRDSEYPFALLETRIVQERFSGLSRLELKQRLDPAFRSFNEARNQTLTLYPTVLETLSYLRNQGVTVVGHTEASAPNAFFRLRKLGCLPFISRLYALEHLGEDHPVVEKSLRFQEGRDLVHFLKANQRKPNPSILLTICKEYDVPTEQTLYIGDSVSRDISMAKEARTWSALAEYGLRFDKSIWARLVRVTHWSADDIRLNEEMRKSNAQTKADVVLDTQFAQIREHFSFGHVK